jgi:hypothetical protein
VDGVELMVVCMYTALSSCLCASWAVGGRGRRGEHGPVATTGDEARDAYRRMGLIGTLAGMEDLGAAGGAADVAGGQAAGYGGYIAGTRGGRLESAG